MGLLYLEGLLMARVLDCGLARIPAMVALEAQRYDNKAHACNILVSRLEIDVIFSRS